MKRAGDKAHSACDFFNCFNCVNTLSHLNQLRHACSSAYESPCQRSRVALLPSFFNTMIFSSKGDEMIIIIDGYNLLRLVHGSECNDAQRRAFVNFMGRYMKKRLHKLVIVFDAGPCTYPRSE